MLNFQRENSILKEEILSLMKEKQEVVQLLFTTLCLLNVLFFWCLKMTERLPDSSLRGGRRGGARGTEEEGAGEEEMRGVEGEGEGGVEEGAGGAEEEGVGQLVRGKEGGSGKRGGMEALTKYYNNIPVSL